MENGGKLSAFTQPQINGGLHLLRNSQIIFFHLLRNSQIIFNLNLLQQNFMNSSSF